jgi:Raf kinase inhibitor-like YbhB/YbcL family protein
VLKGGGAARLALPGLALALALFPACGSRATRLPPVSREGSIRLTSPAFRDGGPIPAAYTCDGRDVSPPLAWTGGPPAEEYALVVIDVDAPGGSFTHWVAYGIPGSVSALPEGGLPEGTWEGTNDFRQVGYRGPCPPPGRPHRYVFTIYALRTAPPALGPGASLQEVLDAIRCCIEAKGTLVGTYAR